MFATYPPRTIGEAIWDWFEGRNYWRLLLAVPAFIGLAGLGAFVFFHLSWSATRAEASCIELGGKAMAAGRFQRAALAYQCLLRLRGTAEPDHLFRIARCYGDLNRRPEAAAMLSELAPLAKPGHLPAHLFLASVMLNNDRPSAHALAQAETHCLNVLKQESQNPDAREMLGQIYLRLGRWDEARKQLVEVVAARPEVALQLALTQKELGDDAGARAWATRAAKTFSAQCELGVTDTPRARLSWANALALLKDYPQAAAVVETGREKTSNANYDSALAQVCGLWAAQLREEQATNAALRVQVLRKGLECSPGNATLLAEFLRWVRVARPEAQTQRRALTKLLAEGRDAPWLHLALGCLAHQTGETNQAGLHFKAALNASPSLASVANNLAAALAEERPPELPLALALMQPVLALAPQNPFFRDTRGQLLLRHGDAKAAVADLEFALPQLSEKTTTHRALAEAYTKLGLTEKAAAHARQADAAGAPNAPR